MKEKAVKIAPSLLSADFSHLAQEIKTVEPYSDMLHIDVMDGHFVPNITIGPLVVASIRSQTHLFLDVHLMIELPEVYVAEFAQAGADLITVHAEASRHLHRLIQQVKQTGKKVGVALNPGSSLSLIEEVLPDLDLVLLMTVNPGFGGQDFIYSVLPKINRLKELINQRGLLIDIEVDGGINVKTAPLAVQAGANVLVAGSAVFGQQDRKEAIIQLRHNVIEA